MSGLVLSLFPGIGLLDMAFEEEGFCVVRGPDLLWGGDVRRFHPPPGRFDGVIGGPPCQAFSRLRHFVEHNGYDLAPNLIPEFERCVAEAQPAWFVMENVPAAPAPRTALSQRNLLINNRWCGGVQNRVRRIAVGGLPRFHVPGEALEPADWAPAVMASGGYERNPLPGKKPRCGYKTEAAFREAVRLQGLPEDFDLPPFTVAAKVKAIGNGVPLPMGRAIARAVKAALQREAA